MTIARYTSPDGIDWTGMQHPDNPASPPAIVTGEAFDTVWKAKGWQEVAHADADQARRLQLDPTTASAAGPNESGPVSFTGASADAFTAAELTEAAQARGLPTSGSKAEVLGRLQEHEGSSSPS